MFRFKKYTVAIIVSVFTMFFIGLFNRPTEAAAADSDTLRIGMEANYPPYNWTQQDDSNGAIPIDGTSEFANGYDVEVAKLIGKKLHKKVVAVKTSWDGLLPSVTSGKIDLIIAGMSPTPERSKAIDFTIPYEQGTITVIVKKDSKYANAKSINDFKGAKFTGQLGTFHYDLMKQMTGVKRQPAMKDFSAMRVALNSNIIDGYVAENVEALSIKISNPNFKAFDFKGSNGFKMDPTQMQTAVGVKKGNPLKDQVNNALSTLTHAQEKKMMAHAVSLVPNTKKETNWFISMMKQYGPMLLRGIGMTLFISMFATIAGFFIGLLVSIIRTIPVPNTKGKGVILKITNWLLAVYIEVFRGTPMMVQAAVFYYGLAQVFNINLGRTVAALIIVSINTGAYLAEIIRGGIISTPNGQFEAATALGMSHYQRMKKIILPQAIRNSLPSITNEFIVNIKDTSVLSIISVSELFFTGSTIAGQSFQFFHTYLTISAIYLILTFTITRIFRVIEKRLDGPSDYNLMANQNQVTTDKRGF